PRHLHSIPTRRSSDLRRRTPCRLTITPSDSTTEPRDLRYQLRIVPFGATLRWRLKAALELETECIRLPACQGFYSCDPLTSDARSEEHTSELQSRVDL